MRYTRDFADRRRVTDTAKQMNRLYVVESSPSLTGAKAEHRLPMKSGEIEGFTAKLAGVVGAGAPAAVPGTQAPGGELVEKWVAAVAKDLQAHRGRSVVIPGEYQPASVHALAHAMNQALGNVGATVSYTASIDPQPADPHASIAELATAMDAGQVQLLVILGNNPAFTAPADVRFGERLGKVSLVAYLGLYNDETANLAHWFVPEAHPLESWGDPRAYDGTVTLMQPLIAPLYDAHTAHEMLATLTSEPTRRTLDMIKGYWTRGFAGAGGWAPRTENGETFGNADAFWKQVLHDGFIRGTATAAGGPATALTAAPVTAPVMPAAGAATPGVVVLPATPSATTASTAAQAAPPAPSTPAPVPAPAPTPPPAPALAGGLELVFRPDPTVWDGRFANNGWLQEAPKPLTKLTWDTAAWISPKLAETRGLDRGDVIELKYRGATAKMPVFIVPGQPDETVTVFLGYGRRMAGHVGNAVDQAQAFNAYQLRTSDAPWFGNGLEITRTGERYLLATTQDHHAMEGRHPARVSTLAEYEKDPGHIQHMTHTFPKALTLYPDHEYTGYKWGMAIDLTSCTGCGTCVVACVAENNIPVVGKEQVSVNREMHWIRVDHYFTGDIDRPESVQSVHQPVPCQQCENAPCEVVCPVAATTHSAEGLNDMVYNRCVGTRYCSNNCPYKVRRFNFLLYSDWNTQSYYSQRNPDVTVRSRGVMEKCTYCVQRINHARIDAKKDGRSVRDGEIVTACEAACPADAIVFGDLNDGESRVARLKAQQRNYGVLEDLNTRPRTTYLASLRNPNPELEPASTGRTTGH